MAVLYIHVHVLYKVITPPLVLSYCTGKSFVQFYCWCARTVQVDLKLKTGKELNFSLHFRNGVVHFRIARSHYQYSRSCFLHLPCLMARRCSRYFVDLFQRSILMKQTVFEFSRIGPFHSFFRRQFGTGRHFFKAVKIQLPFKR